MIECVIDDAFNQYGVDRKRQMGPVLFSCAQRKQSNGVGGVQLIKIKMRPICPESRWGIHPLILNRALTLVNMLLWI